MSTETLKAIAVVAELPPRDGPPLSPIAEAIRIAPPTAWRSPKRTKKERKPMIALAANATTAATPASRLRLRQVDLVKTIGARLKASRELNNLSLSEAAARLGYSNPSKLSKVENATDTNSVPLWLVRDAARLYDVSVDYLFGLAQDWETGIPRGMTGWLIDEWESQRRRDIAALASLAARVDACVTLIPALSADALAARVALDRIAELNPESWPEIRGAGKLFTAIECLEKSTAAASVAERRLRLDITRSKAARTGSDATPAAEDLTMGGDSQ